MKAMRVLAAAAFLLPVLAARSAEPASEAKTVMAEKGKLLFSDDLATAPGKDWKVGKGKWEVADGALRGVELKEDMHGAVMRHDIKFDNAVIEFSFKLQGAKTSSLSINDSTGHICRLAINPAGFALRKDQHDKKPATEPGALMAERKVAIKPGEWHTVVVEIQGAEMAAALDGKEPAFGEHAGIKVPKSNFGFTVAGDSVSFKNVRVWEATPKKDWEAAKAKLLEARKAKGGT